VSVDEGDGEFGPRGKVAIAYGLDESFLDGKTGRGVIP
jgi:hypothetical protein